MNEGEGEAKGDSGGGGDKNSSIDDFSFRWPLFVCSRGKLSTLSPSFLVFSDLFPILSIRTILCYSISRISPLFRHPTLFSFPF